MIKERTPNAGRNLAGSKAEQSFLLLHHLGKGFFHHLFAVLYERDVSGGHCLDPLVNITPRLFSSLTSRASTMALRDWSPS